MSCARLRRVFGHYWGADGDMVAFLYVTFAPTAARSALHIGGLAERLLIIDRDVWYAIMGWQFFTRATAPDRHTLQRERHRLRSHLGPLSF